MGSEMCIRDSVRVRRGLTQMNSQANVIEALGGTGISLPGTQWFSPDSPWYSEEVAAAWPTFDFDAGAATLQEYIDDPERSDGKAPGELIDVENGPEVEVGVQTGQVRSTAGRKVVENRDPDRAVSELPSEVGSDEAGTPGDQNSHAAYPFPLPPLNMLRPCYGRL